MKTFQPEFLFNDKNTRIECLLVFLRNLATPSHAKQWNGRQQTWRKESSSGRLQPNHLDHLDLLSPDIEASPDGVLRAVQPRHRDFERRRKAC